MPKTLAEYEALLSSAPTFKAWRGEYLKRLKNSDSILNTRQPKSERQDIKLEIESLLDKSSKGLDLFEVFPDVVATHLTEKAKFVPVAPEFLMQPLIAICGSILGKNVKVRLKDEYAERMVFWTGIIGDPGDMKSPSIGIIQAPLKWLQNNAAIQYESDFAEFQQNLLEWDAYSKEEKKDNPKPEPPLMRDYFIDRTTMEALMEAHAEPQNRKGFVWIVDEMSGLISGLGQYKKGGSDDRQRLLTLWTSGHDKKNRMGSKTYIDETFVSITGGVQASILAKLMGDQNDADGLWGRILWSSPERVRVKWIKEDFKIYEFLLGLYKSLDSVPETELTLSNDSHELYAQFIDWTEAERIKADSAIQNVLAKLRAYCARFAGLLHMLEASTTPNTQFSTTINSEIFTRAIKISLYFYSQVWLLHRMNRDPNDEGAEKDLAPKLMKIYKLSQEIGWVSVRLIQQKKWAKNAEHARSLLSQLVDVDCGQIQQITKFNWEWHWSASEPKTTTDIPVENQHEPQHSEIQPEQEFQAFVEKLNPKKNLPNFSSEFRIEWPSSQTLKPTTSRNVNIQEKIAKSTDVKGVRDVDKFPDRHVESQPKADFSLMPIDESKNGEGYGF
ncbi:MAG: DUF3987 domain-containing protein [Cyanobacteria bacterium P01_D01_bin.36]